MRNFQILAAIVALAGVQAPVAAEAQDAPASPAGAMSAANADLAPAAEASNSINGQTMPASNPPAPSTSSAPSATTGNAVPSATPATTVPAAATTTAAGTTVSPTYHQQDILAAAEDTFGKGAEGLAKMIEKLFKERGEPNAYIVGREVGGAVLLGVRYGSGTMFHKVEGNLPVYWTGPSFGLDLGANGAKTFMLVYNLDDSEDLYRRFPGAEGAAYVVGGFTASHHHVGKIAVVPVHVGMGWRLGANIGYLKFSKTSQVSPF